jgi:hypothetical protein
LDGDDHGAGAPERSFNLGSQDCTFRLSEVVERRRHEALPFDEHPAGDAEKHDIEQPSALIVNEAVINRTAEKDESVPWRGSGRAVEESRGRLGKSREDSLHCGGKVTDPGHGRE